MRRMGLVGVTTAALALTALSALPSTAAAGPDGEAPGTPGDAARWTTGAKQGIGTSTTTTSKVWHTLADGVLTEVY